MNRLHPLSAVTMALQRGLIGMSIPFFLVTVLAGFVELVSLRWLAVLAPLGFVLGAAYGVGYYYRFEYELTAETFDVASGVLSRRDREIPYRRIQNVDVTQGVLFRLFGFATVSIETAGGGNTEGLLNFVSDDEATRLQREIRRRTAEATTARKRATDAPEADSAAGGATGTDDNAAAGAGPPTAEPTDHAGLPDGTDALEQVNGEHAGSTAAARDGADRDWRPKLLFRLTSRELLLYSFTSFRPAAVAGVLALVFFFSDLAFRYVLVVSQPIGGPADLASATPGSYVILSVVSIVNGVLITYLLSVTYTFATYYGFQLGRAGEDFVYERGLLQRYSGSIPSDKVQSVTITDNPLQRLIEYAGLWVETAGYGPDSDSGSQSAVPLAQNRRVHRFTENLTGVEKPAFEQPPTLARRRYLARYAIVATVVVAVFFGISLVTALERWYLAAVVFAAVPPAAQLRYANLGYYVGDDHLVIRRGFWRRRTTVIPYYRIQTINVRRSIFQRRLGLASVVVDTASSQTFTLATPTIYDVSLESGRGVQRDARARLQRALRERRESDDDGGVSVAFT